MPGVVLLLLCCYMIYGIVHIVKNKSLSRPWKIAWVALALFLPFLGTTWYLKMNFEERHCRR